MTGSPVVPTGSQPLPEPQPASGSLPSPPYRGREPLGGGPGTGSTGSSGSPGNQLAAEVVVELGPPPTPPLSINKAYRMNHHARHRQTAPWREHTAWLAHAQRTRQQVGGRPSTITVVLPVVGNRRRDPHNYVPTVKAIVDGLVDAHVWPDDTPEYVTVLEPVLVIDGTDVRVHIAPRENPA